MELGNGTTANDYSASNLASQPLSPVSPQTPPIEMYEADSQTNNDSLSNLASPPLSPVSPQTSPIEMNEPLSPVSPQTPPIEMYEADSQTNNDSASNLASQPLRPVSPQTPPIEMNRALSSTNTNNVERPLSQLIFQNTHVGVPAGYHLPPTPGPFIPMSAPFGYPFIPPGFLNAGLPPIQERNTRKEHQNNNTEGSSSNVIKIPNATTSTGNAAVGSSVDTGAKYPKKSRREVEFSTFNPKVQDWRTIKRPSYYIPKMLTTWNESDYIKHEERFNNKVLNTAFEKTLDELKFDIGEFKEERSVTMKPVNTLPLKIARKPTQRTDRWWIVADTKVLLDDVKFIDRLLNKDPTCRLLLPYEVLYELTSMMARVHELHMRIPSRRVARYMDAAIEKNRAFINRAVTYEIVTSDDIVKSCLQLHKYHYYVILITDDVERQNLASSLNVPWFTLDRAMQAVQNYFIDENSDLKLQLTVSKTNASNLAIAQSPEQREEDSDAANRL